MAQDVYAYCVLDKKAKIYHQPHFLINDAVAVRQFSVVVNHEDGMIKKYPEDYALYRVGVFDMTTGIIIPEDYPVEVASGLNLRKLNGGDQ